MWHKLYSMRTLQTHAPAIRLVNVFILMRFPPSTLIRCVRFRFDPFSTAFSNWSVFDENAQHIVWAENLYTSKCMDFQMKTHFGPLHHGPKAHFYQIFHSKTAKTKSMHNWGKKKRSYKWKYYEVLAKNSTLSISGLFWTTLNSVNFVLFKIWKGFLNKCNFFNTPNKKG